MDPTGNLTTVRWNTRAWSKQSSWPMNPWWYSIAASILVWNLLLPGFLQLIPQLHYPFTMGYWPLRPNIGVTGQVCPNRCHSHLLGRMLGKDNEVFALERPSRWWYTLVLRSGRLCDCFLPFGVEWLLGASTLSVAVGVEGGLLSASRNPKFRIPL